LTQFYTQSVSWTPCEGQFQCANIKVPTDYKNPQGESIQISAIKLATKGKKLGTILVNPGGPGGSGYDFVRDAATTNISAKLRASYDVLGFDPRGVKRSAPVTCLDDKARDASRAANYDLNTDAGLAQALADNKKIIDACVQNTGPRLGFIDTVSAAKDMDIIRAVVNDKQLNYLGYSYGTSLGTAYAEQFPKNVGKMVLDGAVDPQLSNAELTLEQARAFEAAIRAYVTDCLQQSQCPLSGSVDSAINQIRDLITAVQKSPMRAKDGRIVTGSTFVSGFILPFYNNENWPVLTDALTAAFKGDASPMLRLADFGADRSPDGTYSSNSTFAFTAINCLDYPMVTDAAGMRAEEQQLVQASPTLGYFFAYGGVNCTGWPYPPAGKPHAVNAPGVAPVVVVGTTGDPATPYQWAQSLSKQLPSSTLVTWHGQGHTAYGRSNACVTNAVDGYFVDGKLPSNNTQC
jgi:pimeloyl-ACP methyl ester carboxylesterase